jgi:3-deoxy-manno-octulosonate cytidylyltransferase (CMP-KDO synthetase)
MDIICVIPARLASSRLPRKALLPIQGKPMVQWVYESAVKANLFSEVIVATDHDAIANVISKLGGKVCLTDENITTGTDRVAEVARNIANGDIIINLQGDMPFVNTQMLKALIAPFNGTELPDMATLACPIRSKQALEDPSTVKVLVNCQKEAIYFSRAAIPFYRNQHVLAPVYHHLGLYAFRRDFLLHYPTLTPTPLELTESLEQLRALEHGYRIRISLTPHSTLEINTEEDYQQAQQYNIVESI